MVFSGVGGEWFGRRARGSGSPDSGGGVRGNSTSGTASRTHVNWVTGTVDDTGFTTTFGPNQVASDFVSIRENQNGSGAPQTDLTYAAVLSRSFHTGIVHALLLDGSARVFSENLDPNLWRALGSRNGGEVVGDY